MGVYIRRILCVGLGVIGLATSRCSAMGKDSIRVWATGDGVRVSPETGKYLEDRTDIHKGYPTGGYRERNAVWDAAKGLVVLHAARNEFVAFQVVVAAVEPVSGVKVTLDGLTGPGNARLTDRNVALLKAWYVRVRKHSTGYQDTYVCGVLHAAHRTSSMNHAPAVKRPGVLLEWQRVVHAPSARTSARESAPAHPTQSRIHQSHASRIPAMGRAEGPLLDNCPKTVLGIWRNDQEYQGAIGAGQGVDAK